MTFKAGEQVQWCDLDGWSGKMSPELLAVTKEETSQPSLKKRSKSSNRKPPLFLFLTRDGLQQDACPMWTENGALLGEYTTRSFGECPSEENVSRLSAILEDAPHPKYYLSAKACKGILNRVERRGKKLPEQLETALRAQAALQIADITGNIAETLRSDPHGAYPHVYGIGNGQAHEAMTMAQEVSQTLNTMHDKQAILYQPKSAMEENWTASETKNALRAGESKVSHAVLCEDVSHTLRAKANCAYREDTETYPVQNMMVRRLTPMECERLQGYPDGWTDIGEWTDSKGKKHQTSDTSRYKALGNSIALPFWYWMMQNMAEYLPEKPTLGSLFDGIGGFPLCWERIHGKGTARWASEIEEFPMAVTKKRFGEG